MEDLFWCGTHCSNKFAIKLGNEEWFLKEEEKVFTFTTEKKAEKYVAFIKESYPDLDVKVVAVEEEMFIDTRNPIHRQTIREL